MKIKLLMQIDANMKQKSNRNRNEKRMQQKIFKKGKLGK